MNNANTANKRRLGASGLAVSPVGLGCMSLSGVYGAADDAAGIALIHHALDQGVDFFDTADVYGGGHNEQLVGQAIAGRRDALVLATKFGHVRQDDGSVTVDGRPEYVATACEASLKRLGVETIDIYFQHRVDRNVPIEDTVGAMARLVAQGKVRALGLGEAGPDTIRRAHKEHPIAAVQSEYSLLYRSDAEAALEATRELGIAFVAYAPLGRSLLTNQAPTADSLADSDQRKRFARFDGENFKCNRQLVERLDALAAEKGCTTPQLALAWLLAQGDDIIVIPGTKRIERLDENLEAAAVDLTVDDVARISQALPPGAGAGDRYPAAMMGNLNL